ncbi:MAG: hypothetical protein JRG76_20355, partial [Deltaproteobacteria bacterium]|nr:hypothetical protein [Deltaproteobacteria bacterium]
MSGGEGSGEGLRAGAVSVDITPSDLSSTWLAGFGLNRRATGILEPLSASVLYLSAGGSEVVLVSADLIGLGRSWIDAIAARTTRLGGAALICGSTHTHSAPDTLGIWGRGLFGEVPVRSGVDRSYLTGVVERIAAGIDRAIASSRPVRMRSTSFDVPEHWTRNDRKGGARYDRAVAAAFDGEDGERVATLLNYACHPETLWDENRLVSPDFPGAFRRRASELAGGVALYLSGPLGAMLTPDVPLGATAPQRQQFAEEMGRALAELGEQHLAACEAKTPDALHHASVDLTLRNRNWRFQLFRMLRILETRLQRGRVEMQIHHLRVGDLEMLTAPGEVVPELGRRIHERMSA